MPQLDIEYSANLPRQEGLRDLALALHRELAEATGAELESFKTRLSPLPAVVIGDGAAGHAMLHLDVRLLSGRTPAQKQAAGERAMALVLAHLGEPPPGLSVQVTCEVADLDRENYHKVVLGRLAPAAANP